MVLIFFSNADRNTYILNMIRERDYQGEDLKARLARISKLNVLCREDVNAIRHHCETSSNDACKSVGVDRMYYRPLSDLPVIVSMGNIDQWACSVFQKQQLSVSLKYLSIFFKEHIYRPFLGTDTNFPTRKKWILSKTESSYAELKMF